jgi:hypothetical protein
MMLTPRVIMTLLDGSGDEIATVEAPAQAGFLRPTQSAPFRVEFPAVFSYEAVEFETAGDGLSMRPEDAGPPSDETEEGVDAEEGEAIADDTAPEDQLR